MEKIMFSINEYDYDGYIVTKGVFLHFGKTRVFVCEDINEFCDKIGPAIQNIVDEITYDYSGGKEEPEKENPYTCWCAKLGGPCTPTEVRHLLSKERGGE